jgi:hypothetical protein
LIAHHSAGPIVAADGRRTVAKLRVAKSFIEYQLFGGALSPVSIDNIHMSVDGYIVFDISGGCVPDTDWVSSVVSEPEKKLSFIPD